MNNFVASITIVRQLVNENKNIHDVIGMFIREIIYNKNLECFTVKQVQDYLETDFGFDLPVAVVYYSTKRLNIASIVSGIFTLTDKSWHQEMSEFKSIYEHSCKDNRVLEADVISYFRKRSKQKKSIPSDNEIMIYFAEFLLDENKSRYKEIFSLFVVEHHSKYKDQLQTIKEGAILIEGLKYDHKELNSAVWNNEIDIYLDTEILFHLAGYNGKIYKDIFSDFYCLIGDINSQIDSKDIIKLKYFSSSDSEIDGYFSTAIRIKEGKETLDPTKDAMSFLVNGNDSVSSIIEMKSDFYLLLDKLNIMVDETNYHNEEFDRYNIESISTVENMRKSMPKRSKNIERHLNKISNINKIRKGINTKSFEKIGAILVSASGVTFELSKHFKNVNEVPLCTSLEFLTNKFWLKLNKNFVNAKFIPKSFDVYTKARIIISNSIGNRLEAEYDKLLREFSNDERTQEEYQNRYVAIRSALREPEKIVEEDSEEYASIITEDEFNLKKYELDTLTVELRSERSSRESAEKIIVIQEEFINKYKKLDDFINNALKIIRYFKKNLKLLVFNIIFISAVTFIAYKFKDNVAITGAATLFSTFIVFYSPIKKLLNNAE